MPRIPYFYEGLTPEIVKRAEIELGETEEVRTQCLKELKRLIKEEPDFQPRTEDAFLLRFLRTKKFNVKKAFKILQNYYRFKANYSGILMDLAPSQIKPMLVQGNGMMLKYRNDDDVGVGLIRVGKFDIDKFTPDAILGGCLCCTEVGLEPEITQVVGYALIFDFSGFTLRMAKYYSSPTFLYRLVHAVQDCMPCRIKGYHIVNEPLYFNVIGNVLKSFMSEKLRGRIHIHGSNLKSLHKYISPDILPEELGGNQGPLSNYTPSYIARILSKEDHLIRTNKYGYQGKTLQKLRSEVSKSMETKQDIPNS